MLILFLILFLASAKIGDWNKETFRFEIFPGDSQKDAINKAALNDAFNRAESFSSDNPTDNGIGQIFQSFRDFRTINNFLKDEKKE